MEKGVTHVPPGKGCSLWVLDELVTYKVVSEQTGGAYSFCGVMSRPGSGPSLHLQHRGDESFCVLEGEYEFLDDGHTFVAGPGSLIYVPRASVE